MKQLIQSFKTGDLYVDEVPIPSLSKGMVLVENRFSLISAGTERGTVKVAKSSLLGKAKQRPDLVAQVLQNIKREGLKATIKKVKTKLDSPKALGYSTAGIVQASLDTNSFFKPGDRVACAGQDYASHAEFVTIPQNLVVKIPEKASFEEASFSTVGAIAMQGVRQSESKLGEYVCVIGLGLLGQITCQLLKASGCNVFGVDLSQDMITMAEEVSSATAMNRNDENLISAIENFTNGHGFDSVIITAAAPSNDPIELSAKIVRKKGKIVIVGAVKMDLPRLPHFYNKELDLRMSCSYGPGRYDVAYEENGKDYPYAYVRWTEQRNMQAFLQLIAEGALNIKPLISHVFDIDDAIKAYDIILGKTEEMFVGLLLEYPESKDKFKTVIPNPKHQNVQTTDNINVGFIGAGSFAQSYLIPHVKGKGNLDMVVTSKGITAKSVASKFGFLNSTANFEDVINKKEIDTVFIATQHNTHAQYVVEALKGGKKVFVEKPLALNEEELEAIIEAYNEAESPLLMVGYNRRFSPVCVKAKELFQGIDEPLVMNFRVNAGFIERENWYQNEEFGGGRIVGEVCHWVDLMQYFTGAYPVSVYADCISSSNEKIKNDDNISIVIKFSDGSIGNLLYLANGDKSMPKEKLEIFGGNKIFVVDDFKKGHYYNNNKKTKFDLFGKGHKQEIQHFLSRINKGEGAPISFESLILTTRTTFKILDSISTGLPHKLSLK